jgi:ubiquinone/menaquinone biosynthesis C-methylase UbiE
MNGPNREQIELWNRLGRRWAIYQERLDRVWRPLGDTAIDRAAVQPGERVIDVGCGCGATALELATRAGSKGSVIGVDVSAPMLQRARERAQTAGVTNLAFIQADASAYKFSNDADLIFSRTGVMFFSDTVAAFANLRRALRPGGRLVFVCFRDRELNSWWTVPLAAAATVVAVEPPTPPRQPGPFALAEESYLREILDRSGFVDAVCEPRDYDLIISDNLESASDFVINAGSAAGALASACEDQRVQAGAAIRLALTQYASSTGVSLRAATWIVRAIKPC